ncbi:hypothetical protein ACJX0J_023708, partial [Zea mays]
VEQVMATPYCLNKYSIAQRFLIVRVQCFFSYPQFLLTTKSEYLHYSYTAPVKALASKNCDLTSSAEHRGNQQQCCMTIKHFLGILPCCFNLYMFFLFDLEIYTVLFNNEKIGIGIEKTRDEAQLLGDDEDALEDDEGTNIIIQVLISIHCNLSQLILGQLRFLRW